MTVTERVDRFQRRHPGVGFPLAVLYKFGDDDSHFLARRCMRPVWARICGAQCWACSESSW
ncbi:MAG: hypothetical protein ABWY29_01340 [Blastococcus sp.]